MGFFKELKEDPVKAVRESLSFFYGPTEEQAVRNKACDDLIARIDEALVAVESIFSAAPTESIDIDLGHAWQAQYRALLIDIQPQNLTKHKKATQYNELIVKQQEIDFAAKTILQRIRRHNTHIKEGRSESNRFLR